jgi:hypothetical protein
MASRASLTNIATHPVILKHQKAGQITADKFYCTHA